MPDGIIMIFGGTGFYGSHIVRKLLAGERPVRVLSRDAARARNVLGNAVDIIEGDVASRETIIECLRGVGAVIICLSAISRKLIRRMDEIERVAVLAIMEEAHKARISRLVYVSGYEIRKDVLEKLNILPFGAIKLEIEEKIRASDFNWTILGDAPSFELFFAFLRGNRLIVPGGGLVAVPTISPEDIGEITAQVVLRADLGQKRFRLTGPEAISFPEAAHRISALTGKRIRHINLPLFIFRVGAMLALPFTPFVRFLYWSLKLLNHFPKDLAGRVPQDHQILLDTFSYSPVTFNMEIERRLLAPDEERP
ncbi:SDR family oxidoreductase [Candidatus Neomarinimicrobiota bacterium]